MPNINEKQTTSSVQEWTFTNELRENFWQHYDLTELTQAEWEALCDGCGACCLVKFLEEEDEPDAVEYTDVACQLLDCQTGYCSNYEHRQRFVPDCISLTVDKLQDMLWLPHNCAYKRLFLGQPLPQWHLLITKDKRRTRQGMKASGVGVAGRCISETVVSEDMLEERIVQWVYP
ncbi:YcgN family cysteine cluster protein [Psychrobacter sp. I-STPA6b]|uniref:YcgN family cysteine cluster protein n=1 Tax=Psychrobacter sp. I-STPA6b TaxID=2585718 RepID=UPI001D0C722F|nr:YcgN family cysteine cluster protein [Psychrobacter sp. I-STPA6b]